MSRAGAQRPAPTAQAGTPVWVWVVYGLGFLGALVLVGSAVASAAMVIASDATVSISFPALAICVVLVGAAVAVKVQRTRAGR
jgi:hypothetical protein